jgi:membrane protein
MEANDIITNLNYLLEKVFKSIEGEIFKTLDKLTIIGPEILKEEPLKNIVFENKVNGLVIIANTLILFFVIYYVFKQLIGIYNGNKIESIYVFIIRIIIVCIIVNFSYYICEEILNIFGILGESIDTYASDLINRKVTFENLKDSIINIENIINTDLVSLDGIIKGIISFGSVSILISFSVRYVTVIFLIIISPLAFVCLSSNLTSGIFNMWVKMLIVNLTLQIGIKLLIFIPLAYKNQNDIIYKIILVGTISLIYKFNIFIKELLARISNENNVKNIFKD